MSENIPTSFSQMELKAPLLKALNQLGYELPTAIQAQTIPLLLEGRDVLGTSIFRILLYLQSLGRFDKW